MKRIFFGLLIVLAVIFSYQYQTPIISTEEAIHKAKEYLQDPPKEWNEIYSAEELKNITSQNISVSLNQKDGFINKLTNKRQWEINIVFDNREATVVIDAYSGKFIDIYGPLN